MSNRALPLLMLLVAFAVRAGEPQVQIGDQTLHGKMLEGSSVAAFLGVPFAAPPVGDLRWRAPQPYTPISAGRDVTEFAPACMQAMRILDWYRDYAEVAGADRSVMPDLEVSEDCLYVNVWTPSLEPDAALPVMVYIHGGSNRSGWSYEPNYHGQVLAAEGVVVISIAYRLGDFGFFAHPDFSQQEAVANFGLWDLSAALQWVQDNAPKFGGDNSRVTVFGESSGAEDIVALVYSSHADELFDQAILQSTAGFSRQQIVALDDARRRGEQLASVLGNKSALSIEEMRQIPADKFLALSEQNGGGHYHSPVVDGTFLDRIVFGRSDVSDVKGRPVIIGTNLNESYAGIPEDADGQYVRELAEDLFGDDAADALAAVQYEADPRAAADRMLTAVRFQCPSQQFAETLAGNGSPVWMYRFSRARDDAIGAAYGAYHGAELPYVFGTHDAWMSTTEADLQITADTMSYWLTFAKSGDPNSPATESWPRYQGQNPLVRDIDVAPKIIAAPDAVLCDLARKIKQ